MINLGRMVVIDITEKLYLPKLSEVRTMICSGICFGNYIS